MDSENQERFVSEEAQKYWENVDLYFGGSEHATGHLLYSRFWTKFLKDRKFVTVEEPFKKLINQGMILGESAFIHQIGLNFIYSSKSKPKSKKIGDMVSASKLSSVDKNKSALLDDKFNIIDEFISYDFYEKIIRGGNDEEKNEFREDVFERFGILSEIEKLNFSDDVDIQLNFVKPFKFYKKHVPIEFLKTQNELDVDRVQSEWRDAANSSFFKGFKNSFLVSREVEKMSKSKYNVVSPDEICDQYGADSLRLYEMFLGPLEQAKPWNTAGITGVHSFLKKLWKLYTNEDNFEVSEEKASAESLKTLHKTIKKVTEDIEAFSFNTSVSSFMICVNELMAQKCDQREVLEPLAVLIAPYAPHIAEELWQKLGHNESVTTAAYPEFEEKYLVESTKEYPISFNGKMRFTLELPLDLSKDEIEKAVMANEKTKNQLEGRTPKKIIVVPGKIVNIVG